MMRKRSIEQTKIPCCMPSRGEFLDHIKGVRRKRPTKERIKHKINFGHKHRVWVKFNIRNRIKVRWHRRNMLSRKVAQVRLHLRAKVSWQRRFNIETRRYLSNVQLSIPEWDTDGRYQLSPFYGDPAEPEVFQWADMLVTNIGSFHRRDAMVSNVFEHYGPHVELRFTPIRFVFPSKQAATMFLLRFG